MTRGAPRRRSANIHSFSPITIRGRHYEPIGHNLWPEGRLSHHGHGRHLHLRAPFLPDGKLRGRHFSGLEGAWLCLTNSGAALASWGAVFTCLGAQRAVFLGLEGARLWLRNSRAIFASWGAVFRFRVLGWEAQRAAFFRFRGRLVVFDKLRGGTWILGRRFHLFVSSEGGIF